MLRLTTWTWKCFTTSSGQWRKRQTERSPDLLEWLDGFEVFPLNEIMGELKDLLTDTMPTTKKKINDKDSSSGEAVHE